MFNFFLTAYLQDINMIELTINQLRQLKLNGMASALQTQREQPGTYEGLAFAERLQLLVDHEDQVRHQRKQERLTRATQFKLKAYAASYKCSNIVKGVTIAKASFQNWAISTQRLLRLKSHLAVCP